MATKQNVSENQINYFYFTLYPPPHLPPPQMRTY
jgi:hypothetical protein